MKYNIIHSADWHYSPKNREPCLQSLAAMLKYGQEHDVDLWVTAGDIFDHAIYNTGRSGFPDLLDAVYRLLEIAPMVAVTGTPTHDVAGSYDVLRRAGQGRFVTIDPSKHYFLAPGSYHPYSFLTVQDPIADELLIMGMPEPGRAHFTSATRPLEMRDIDIKHGLRDILTGYGAIRASYPDNPCLFLYHGQVAGASLANGQILPGNGIEIGRDDLALVGADYYALGDIHKAQQIPGMNAYYSGSIAPFNWDETDAKTFNAVELEAPGANMPTIQHISFGHPARQKYTIEATFIPEVIGDIQCMTKFGGSPSQVWVEIRDKGEIISQLDETQVTDKILRASNAADGSRVTFSAIPTQTIRSAEIREVKTLYDKIKVWADLSDLRVPDDQAFLSMCERIESEARETGDSVEPHRWRLARADIHGATGIKKGTGTDGVKIDFDTEYDPGLLLLRGRTGSGKTSVIENLTPFPRMMTRPGKLQDHFFDADSYRDLYYVDEITNDEYRFFITIAGGPKAGQNTYHVYKNKKPLPGITGRLDDYNREVLRLFGSFDLFVRSVFLAQSPPKGVPDIATATATEKKELFRELSGIGHYQTYTELAKGYATELATESDAIDNRIEGMKFGIIEKDSIGVAKKTAESERQGVLRLQSEGVEHKKTLVADVATLQGIVEQNDKHRSAIIEWDKLISNAEGVQLTRIAGVQGLQEVQKKAPEAAVLLAEYEEIKARVEVLANEESTINKRRVEKSEAYHAATKVVDNSARKYEREIANDQAEIRTYETSSAVFEKKLAVLQAQIERVTCPNCATEFVVDAESEAKIPGVEDDIESIGLDICFHMQRIEKREDAKAGLVYPLEPVYPTFVGAAEIRRKRADLSIEYDPVQLQSTITEAITAGARIEEIDKAIKHSDAKMDEWSTRKTQAQGAIDTQAEDNYLDLAQQLKTVEQKITDLAVALSSLDTDIRHYTDRLAEVADIEAKILEETRKIERLQEIQSKWAFIQRACSLNGIQALELDAQSPAITDTTNELLQAAYGSRFAIEIRTTKVSGSGSRAKQIETYDIIVHDSDGDENLLEMLSGGEKIWVRKAIYDAFAINRAKDTGLQFATVFLDEADGALDADSTMMYFRMIEAAHAKGNCAQTIVITHSEIAQEIISQSIDMEEFGNGTS